MLHLRRHAATRLVSARCMTTHNTTFPLPILLTLKITNPDTITYLQQSVKESSICASNDQRQLEHAANTALDLGVFLLNKVRDVTSIHDVKRQLDSLSGGDLTSLINAAVAERVSPIEHRLDTLNYSVGFQNGVINERSHSIKKGVEFEHEIVKYLSTLRKLVGADLNYCGEDNKPGDILLSFHRPYASSGGTNHTDDSKLRIVIEAKDLAKNSALGKSQIVSLCDAAMESRLADAALFIVREEHGLGMEIGDWSEGVSSDGRRWIATTMDQLSVALRVMLAYDRIDFLSLSSRATPGDIHWLKSRLESCRGILRRFRTIKRSSTEAQKHIATIVAETKAMELQLGEALDEMEAHFHTLNKD